MPQTTLCIAATAQREVPAVSCSSQASNPVPTTPTFALITPVPCDAPKQNRNVLCHGLAIIYSAPDEENAYNNTMMTGGI